MSSAEAFEGAVAVHQAWWAGRATEAGPYRTREEARQEVFDYIEIFYNPKRNHARNGMLSPVEFERQRKIRHEGV